MEKGLKDIEGSTIPEKYTISVEEFKTHPVGLEENSNLGKVTRSNFTSTLINTFARSHGVQYAQLTILNWMNEDSGWDYRNTFQNLQVAGGICSLSEDEKAMFVNAYEKVPIHKNNKGMPDFGRDVLRIADAEVATLLLLSDLPKVSSEDLKGVSKAEMLTRVSQKIQVTKSKLPGDLEL